MGKGMKIALLVAGLLTMIVVIFLCTAMFSSNKGAPVPASTQQMEQEDCDAEDRRNKEVEDCGIGVLLDPGKKTTAPAVKPTTKPPVTRCTPTRTRRC